MTIPTSSAPRTEQGSSPAARGEGSVLAPARRADLPLILRLTAQTQDEHRARDPALFAGAGALPAFYRRAFRRAGFLPRATARDIFMIRDGARPVGLVCVVIHAGPPAFAHVIEISILPEFRGRGLARQALGELRDRLARRGVTHVGATVWQGNTASQRLFESAGYAECNRTYLLALTGGPPAPQLRARQALRRLGWAAAAVALTALVALLAYAAATRLGTSPR